MVAFPTETAACATPIPAAFTLLGDDGTGLVDILAQRVRDMAPSTATAPWVDIRAYGALSDGTDARAAIQAAIDAAGTIANLDADNPVPVVVWFPHGRFSIDASLVLRSNVIIDGPGVLQRRAAATATTAFSLFTADALANVTIRNLTAYGVGPDRCVAQSISTPSTLGGRDALLDCNACTGPVIITNCKLYRFRNAILLSSCSDFYIHGNTIDSLSGKTLAQLAAGTFVPWDWTALNIGDPGAGIRILGERAGIEQGASLERSVIAHNKIHCVGLDIGIDAGSQSHAPIRILITANYIAGTASGIQNYTSGGAVPDLGAWITDNRGLHIADNYILLTYQQGIYVREVAGCAIINNKVHRCGCVGTISGMGSSMGGIVVRGTTQASYPVSPIAHDGWVRIEGNEVTDCGNQLTGELDAGIRIDAWQVICKNNLVRRSVDLFRAGLFQANSYGIRGLELSNGSTPTGTGTTANGSANVTMTSTDGVLIGMTYTIAGVTGKKTVLSIASLVVTFDSVMDASGGGKALTSVAIGTGTSTIGSADVTMTSVLGIAPGNTYTISGVTGSKTVLYINTTTKVVTFDSVCDAAGAGKTVAITPGTLRCNWRQAEISGNVVEGFMYGISVAFANVIARTRGSLRLLANKVRNCQVPLYLSKACSPLVRGNVLASANGGAYALYIKDCPYAEVIDNQLTNGTNSMTIGSGCDQSTFYGVGGQVFPSMRIKGNRFDGFTTASISIANTATGDLGILSRCLECEGNFENDIGHCAGSTLGWDAEPTASNYRTWHVGERAERLTPAAGGIPGWRCITKGTKGHASGPGGGCTATIVDTSATVTFSAMAGIVPGVVLTINAVSKQVVSVNPTALTAVMDSAYAADASDTAVTYTAPVFKAEAVLAA